MSRAINQKDNMYGINKVYKVYLIKLWSSLTSKPVFLKTASSIGPRPRADKAFLTSSHQAIFSEAQNCQPLV